MADALSLIFGRIQKRYRDMGDGSHAEVVAVAATGPAAAAHTAVGAAGAACTLTLPAVAGKKHKVRKLHVSYSGVPADGSTIKVTDDGVTVYELGITSGGAAPLDVDIESAVANKAMVFVLSAPGGAVVGRINVPGARTES